jgi:uncharacterized protein (UPF0333 family)
MNTTGKVIIGVIVVLVIAGGAYYWYSHMQSESSAAMTASSTTAMMTGSAAAANNPLPSGTSTSDSSLNQDTAAIDAQMNGLDSDNTQTSASMNDQPVSQQ